MLDTEPLVDETLRAPFPWFGGKRRVADLVWARLGDVQTYNEPFAGSLAVLLGRPHAPHVETVNDLDCYLANFWRALQQDPEGVAYFADSPVNEADLHARHRWLVESGRAIAERVMTEPDFYDVQIAGWWVWGQCLWIGSGWCQSPAMRTGTKAGDGSAQHRRPQLTCDQGINAQRSASSRSGENPHEQHKKFRTSHSKGMTGVHRDFEDEDRLDQVRPHLTNEQGVVRKRFAGTGNGQGCGVHRRWQGGGESGGGSGVHAIGLAKQKPDLSGDSGAVGRGVHASARTEGLYEYLERLAARLRRVRVCCGDWTRVLTPSVTTYVGTCAVFLDPPYKHELRERCYSEDHDISADVRAWALANGDNPDFRIALCGYEGEHEMPDTWECVAWKAHGGYSRTDRGVANRERERIWFSPHCLRPSDGLPFGEISE